MSAPQLSDVLHPVPSARLQPEPDEVLVRRVCGGDPSGFDELYLRHARYVAGTVYRVLGNDGDLDDIVQDAFIVASERLTDLREPSRFRSWVVRIALREASRVIATRRRRGTIGAQLAHSAPRSSDPRALEPADALYAALERMPVKLRVPWSLNRVAGLALGETAQACDVSLATVKRRIAAAEKKIRRMLDES